MVFKSYYMALIFLTLFFFNEKPSKPNGNWLIYSYILPLKKKKKKNIFVLQITWLYHYL